MQKIRNTENVGTVHTQITFKKEKIKMLIKVRLTTYIL